MESYRGGSPRTKRSVWFRRARSILAYWKDGKLFFDNYLTRTSISANLKVVQVLNFYQHWKKAEDLCSVFPEYSRDSVLATVHRLEACTLLLRKGSPEASKDAELARVWSRWLPEGSFHFATKDAEYVRPGMRLEELKQRLPTTPQPPFFKNYPNNRRLKLPPRQFPENELLRVLMARRTHREFQSGGASLTQISTLLSLTWGITGYITSSIFGSLPMKTSPSGGARHPVEVYLMALQVDGLDPGLYHYHPAHHCLTLIRPGRLRKRAMLYCAGQPHAGNAAALFIMTAVFPRSMWKYHTGRAYRVVTLDAGHLGQTFCLVATWLGLAPFTSAALKDTLIEKDLEVDGIRESVIYVCGVGLPATGKGE